MTTAPRRVLPTALKVAAVLSALAIAGFLILRAQRQADDALPASGVSPGLDSSKSLVIDPPAAGQPSPRAALPDPLLLPSSKFGPLPSPKRPTPPQKQ